jgi:hypothetical protein
MGAALMQVRAFRDRKPLIPLISPRAKFTKKCLTKSLHMNEVLMGSGKSGELSLATRIRMKHPTTGLVRDGFIGFSWTSFFFGGIPLLIRGEVGIGLGLIAIHILFSVFTIGLGWLILGIILAFVINGFYTKRLIEQGYVLDDPDLNKVAMAKAKLRLT